jgi:hypothetical protein
MTPADVESFEVERDMVKEAGARLISLDNGDRQGNVFRLIARSFEARIEKLARLGEQFLAAPFPGAESW